MVCYRVWWLGQIMCTLYIFIQGCFGLCGGDALMQVTWKNDSHIIMIISAYQYWYQICQQGPTSGALTVKNIGFNWQS